MRTSKILLIFALSACSVLDAAPVKHGTALKRGISAEEYRAAVSDLKSCEDFEARLEKLPDAAPLMIGALADSKLPNKDEFETSSQFEQRQAAYWQARLGDLDRVIIRVPNPRGLEEGVGMTKHGRKAPTPETSGDVWIRIVSLKRKYFISLAEPGDAGRTSDEAQLQIAGSIEAISPAQKKHVGSAMHVSLLCAQSYSSTDAAAATTLFGSLTLRGSQRSALAYLPPDPFWELHAIIESGSAWLCLGWASLSRGLGNLSSVYFGDDDDVEEFAANCVWAV
jgi:hypothetical protein